MLAHSANGTGPAVVLLHGYPFSRAIWSAQLADLSRDYTVLAPDLPGLGASAPLPADVPRTMASMAQAVLTLLDSLGIQRAAVVGHSMGGYVALALQKLAPERVAGLALVGSQAHPDSPEVAAGRHATAEKVLTEGAGLVAAAMGPKLFGPAAPAALGEQADAIMRATKVESIRDALHAMASRADLREHLASITVPSLILAGTADAVIPAERVADLAARLPNATLVTLEGVGHMPMLEEPAATSAALAHWLGRVYAG